MFINSALTGPDELCDDHRGECSLAEKVDTKSEKDNQQKKASHGQRRVNTHETATMIMVMTAMARLSAI